MKRVTDNTDNAPRPQFTTMCFLRKNSLDVKQRLTELGYVPFTPHNIHNDILVAEAKAGEFWDIEDDMYEDINADGSFGIDCDTNEDLFIALAALREDSDIHQWFTTDDCSDWYLSEHDFCPMNVVSVNRWHKATVEELIRHFATDNTETEENDEGYENMERPQFTTPCFITANTPELRLVLNKLGYKASSTFVCTEKAIWLSGYRYYSTDNICVNADFPIGEIDLPYGRYCGDNVDLFLAVAALRNDSDYMQWFKIPVIEKIDGKDNITEYIWYRHEENNRNLSDDIERLSARLNPEFDLSHKATLEELIEHFTTKQ